MLIEEVEHVLEVGASCVSCEIAYLLLIFLQLLKEILVGLTLQFVQTLWKH